jgi:hypothetical protein
VPSLLASDADAYCLQGGLGRDVEGAGELLGRNPLLRKHVLCSRDRVRVACSLRDPFQLLVPGDLEVFERIGEDVSFPGVSGCESKNMPQLRPAAPTARSFKLDAPPPRASRRSSTSRWCSRVSSRCVA